MFDIKGRRRRRLSERPFPREWSEILDTVPLPRRLPAEDREELCNTLRILMAEKQFEGAGGFAVDDRVRVTIAGQAALLLLHRDTDYFPGLHSIIVYPGEYEAAVQEYDDSGIVSEGDESRAGESWMRGSLVLSWEDVAADLAEAEGSMNVVLHEFTHQLDAETGEMNGLPRIADASLRTDWAAVMSSAYALHVRLVEAERPTLLDPYGAEDPAEFFAVSVEAFFQQPLRVRSGLPALYRLLARYFSQDPAAWADAH